MSGKTLRIGESCPQGTAHHFPGASTPDRTSTRCRLTADTVTTRSSYSDTRPPRTCRYTGQSGHGRRTCAATQQQSLRSLAPPGCRSRSLVRNPASTNRSSRRPSRHTCHSLERSPGRIVGRRTLTRAAALPAAPTLASSGCTFLRLTLAKQRSELQDFGGRVRGLCRHSAVRINKDAARNGNCHHRHTGHVKRGRAQRFARCRTARTATCT